MADQERVPIKVRVVDKRKSGEAAKATPEEAVEASPAPTETEQIRVETEEEAWAAVPQAPLPQPEPLEEHDYLDDLRRVQAEFDNFRKRTFKERQQAEARGKRALVGHLLPVLDNFELAIAHGEGGSGVELVFKELKSALEREGLAEIPAEGRPFDPQVHEAVESVEDETVDQATVTSVYRRGYTFGEDVVRPAMVVVARPVDEPDDRSAEASSEEIAGEAAEGGA